MIQHLLKNKLNIRRTTQTDVNFLYQTLLNRKPDPEGLSCWTGKQLETVITGLTSSQEFLAIKFAKNQLNDKVYENLQVELNPWMAHHIARTYIIQTKLPQAIKILDLGGAHSTDPRGSLLTHGYPYRPQELHIIDLPPEKRLCTAGEKENTFSWGGVSIYYHYTSMSNLSAFEDDIFDFVWSGESIEHISEEDAHITFNEVNRILKKRGKFCLDTPNRKLTELQVGENNFIHPEHKIEYHFNEFIEKFSHHGFTLSKTLGIVHMPKSVTSNIFQIEEYKKNRSINNDPDNSYMFYLEYIK